MITLNDSEFLENLEEIFSQNYIRNDISRMSKYSITQWCVTRLQMRLNSDNTDVKNR